MDEHFRYEDLEPEFVRMYTDLFTEEEMRGISDVLPHPRGPAADRADARDGRRLAADRQRAPPGR
jgi:hypothetical protein